MEGADSLYDADGKRVSTLADGSRILNVANTTGGAFKLPFDPITGATTTTKPLPVLNAVLTMQVRFYGHDQSKHVVPPELPFLGCTFYFCPYYRGDHRRTDLWRSDIEHHGGSVVDLYDPYDESSAVTHVVTPDLSGTLPKMAIKNGVRVVQIYWIFDVMKNKRLLPPFRFYHLPVCFHIAKPLDGWVSSC